MQVIERINLPKPDTHCFDDDTKSDVWSYSRELVREIVLAHIDALTAEISASDIAIAEYRQQCLDNAAEIARLRAESEERLQNCAALVAENERLRKDAERRPMTDEKAYALAGAVFPYSQHRKCLELIRDTEAFHDIKGTP